jgi:GNAT superfamily N-acetyltransferase
MRLIRASGALLESLLDDTFPLWGDGLTRKAYGHWNIAQERTDWGTRHLRRFALMDGARVLSSAKRYDLSLWLKGRRVSALGVGAVFTPESQRGHGHAPAIIKALEDQARTDGAEVSLLFSEIGPHYYQRLGYTQIPLQTVEVEVDEKDGAPAMMVRAGEDADAAGVAAMHDVRARGFDLALLLDDAQVRYSVSKKRMFVGLGTGLGRSIEYFVSEEGHQAVAFLLMQVTRGANGQPDTWSVEACGDRDPSGARIGAMLQVLRARAPSAPRPNIRAWWPDSLRPPQVRIVPRQPAGEVMMLKPLTSGVTLDTLAPDGVMYWLGDVF